MYFCCLEALQNAGKHAGEGAETTVTFHETKARCIFEVADDRRRLLTRQRRHLGHGFVNMSDRVGAFGGSVTVDSAPGQGTKIAGRIPLTTNAGSNWRD